MVRKLIYGLSVVSCLMSHVCLAQNRKIDSLLNLVKVGKLDTHMVFHLNRLSNEYEAKNSFDSAIYYAKLSISNADSLLKIAKDKKVIQATEKWKGYAYSSIGVAYFDQGDYQEALSNYKKSFEIEKKINNRKGVASAYNRIGMVYGNQDNSPEALKNYFASLKIKDEMGDKLGMANTYGNIGLVYDGLGNYEEALKNHGLSLQIAKALGDKQLMANAYNNIGSVYISQKKYPDALVNFISAREIYVATNNLQGIARSYNNIGIIYSRRKDYKDALVNFFESLKMKEKLNYKPGIASSCINIGDVYSGQKNFVESRKYFARARDICVETGSMEHLKDSYKGLMEVDSAMGNFKSAFENNKLYTAVCDSLDNQESRKKTIQSQMTYDFEKKEAVEKIEHKKELENQSLIAAEKSRKQKLILLLVSCFLILVLVFSGFIFRSLRITRKQKNIIEQQKDLVEAQKIEVEYQKSVVDEHQKAIIDSIKYARRIQTSLLPSEKYIERNLERLKKG